MGSTELTVLVVDGISASPICMPVSSMRSRASP